MKPKLKIALFCISCILFLGCDRTTKGLAKEHLMNQAPRFYLNDFLVLHYTENTGAALSLGAGLPQPYNFILLSILPLIFIGGMLVYTMRRIRHFNTIKILSISLIVAGGVGNIVDRILFDRHVTDFLILQVGRFHTGIFNVADLCVTTGIIGLLFFFTDKKSHEEVVEG